jgi:hypothetical protein
LITGGTFKYPLCDITITFSRRPLLLTVGDITYEYKNDIDKKLHKFRYICGTIKRTLKGTLRKDIKLNFTKLQPLL